MLGVSVIFGADFCFCIGEGGPDCQVRANIAAGFKERAEHGERLMTLMTTRSHDQYNTTIYGLDDRYRGVRKGRRVVFVRSGL